MCNKNKLIHVYLILFIICIFIQLSFFIFSHKVNIENYLSLILVFTTVLFSYFLKTVHSLIFTIFIIGIYWMNIMYQNLNTGNYNVFNSYFFIISLLITSFITSNLSKEINTIHCISREFENKYRELITVDELTGLNNKQVFYRHLNKEIKRSLRDQSSLTLMLVKIRHYDNLKSILNKKDMKKLILDIGNYINNNTRYEDEGYRMKDDLIGFLLINSHIKGGELVKNRVKEGINTVIFKNSKNKKISIELQIGILEYHKDKFKDIYGFVKLTEEELEYDC